jgi:uncharacterized protein YktA (UPF0223 family)
MENQTAPTLERTESIVIPFPGQSTDVPSNSPADALSDGQRIETGRTYTFKEAADLLQCGDESTLRNRYWKEKVEPAFRYCPTPLQSIARYDRNDKPIYRLNDAAIEVLRAFLVAKADGREESFLIAARQQYPAPTPSQPELPTPPNVSVETKAAIVIATPELPQTYTLETFQSADAIEIDDPLALANQIVQAVDQVQAAMQQDIERKERKLFETRKAKEIVSAKVQELKLDQRFYQEKATQLSTAQTQDTQTLQELATLLQRLGKPPAASDSLSAG